MEGTLHVQEYSNVFFYPGFYSIIWSLKGPVFACNLTWDSYALTTSILPLASRHWPQLQPMSETALRHHYQFWNAGKMFFFSHCFFKVDITFLCPFKIISISTLFSKKYSAILYPKMQPSHFSSLQGPENKKCWMDSHCLFASIPVFVIFSHSPILPCSKIAFA